MFGKYIGTLSVTFEWVSNITTRMRIVAFNCAEMLLLCNLGTVMVCFLQVIVIATETMKF